MRKRIQASGSGAAGKPVSRWALRFAWVGGGTAWMLHLGLSYAVAEFGCVSGWGSGTVTGLLVAVGVAMLGVAVWATAVSWRLRRDLRGRGEGFAGEVFSARTGAVANVFFCVTILMQMVPIFYFLPGCG